MEGVEDQLARDADEVERPGPVLGEERAGGREVLAVHDLGGLGGEVLVGAVALGEASEGRVERSRFGVSPGAASPVCVSSLA